MKKQDLVKFAELMVVMAEVYDSGRPPSAIKTEVYFKALNGFEITAIQKAIERMIMERVYPSFPKPAEIIQEIQGTTEDRATTAWIEFIKTVKRVGTYESVQFSDPVIHSVCEFMGGWTEVGKWLEAELKWKQKEFERLYSIMSNNDKHPRYLPGIFESQNGTENTKIIQIGHKPELKMIEGGRG